MKKVTSNSPTNNQKTDKSLSANKADEYCYLNNIIKAMPGNVYWKDQDGVYLGCNDATLEMAGMSSVIGKTDFDMPWSEQAQQIRKNDLEVMDKNTTLELEEHAITSNGQPVTVLTRKTPLKDSRGNTVGIIGISLNITERKKYESSLKNLTEQTESTLENIVANMPGHVYWKDRNGTYLGCNIRQAKSLGFSDPKELIGKTDYDLPWGKNLAALFEENDRRIMDSSKAEIIEEESKMDGEKKIVLSHKTPMVNKDGNTIGVLGISIDITDRKKMELELKEAKERAEAANEAKSEFLDNMRHDIRTPLTGITGFASIICDEVNDPKIREYVDNLRASSDSLLNLLNEILEIIAINSGDTPHVKRKFSLKDRLEEAVNLYKAKAKQKNIQLSTQYDDGIPRFLLGDSLRIHRIALELISNAFNFTHSGSIQLITQLAKEDDRNIVVKLIVKDTGVGITPDKQSLIFQQFKRLTPSYKGIYKGAGLGLAIVKEFIDDLDGEIYVESEENSGSSFTCIIPLKKALLDEPMGCEIIAPNNNKVENILEEVPQVSMATPEHKAASKNKILVVEDSAIAATVAKTILTHLDCQVDIAPDGKTGVQLAIQQHYDLIFMDVGLPDIDGLEVTRRIRLQELNKGLHVPIIALTAHIDEENKQSCLHAGMNAVLSKPLSKEKTNDILNAFIPWHKPEPSPETAPAQQSSSDLAGEVIDIDLAMTQMGGERDLMMEMLTMLVHGFPDDLSQFNQAHSANDWPLIQRLVHKMKSGASYCGTVRLKAACDLLETAIKNDKHDSYEPLFHQMMQQIGLVMTTVNKMQLRH